MLYGIVKACQGAAPEDTAHSNMPLYLTVWVCVVRVRACVRVTWIKGYKIHLICRTLRLEINLTSTLQKDAQNH